MRGRILRLLMTNPLGYVSGQEMARLLGVSRAAIHKHVEKLKNYGCDIDCKRNAGYRLISMPDILLPEIVETYRFTDGEAPYTIIHHHVVDSTNQTAKLLCVQGAEEGTVVVAEEQTAGRGRMNRGWDSQPGKGIYTSIILRPTMHPTQAYGLSIVAGIAVARAIAAQGLEDVGLKWPNDVQLNGKKLCGILTEMSATMDAMEYCVVGIGVNVNQDVFPEELASIATSVHMELGRQVPRGQVLAAILAEFFDLYQAVYVTRDLSFSTLIKEYNDLSVLLDTTVTVTIGNVKLEGTCVGFDTDGALLLEEADGNIRSILAGDVSLRGAATYGQEVEEMPIEEATAPEELDEPAEEDMEPLDEDLPEREEEL
ncbi:biotin--[acetyl-CoA-carboxylase] ligase [Eubacteriales bacterium OttesenSCG-928-M02]|nr:biotin--[acetyl-CoA-carboxylase] ligase [Eubacteriales bacterium OttesenSCG-928-M02]